VRSCSTGGVRRPALNAATQLTTRVRHKAWAAWSASRRWRTLPWWAK
jgi:hypothetical protein